MCMNTRDQRLYHYEYRRPRFNNPTYNSNNLFDSLNMFVRTERDNPLLHSYGRFSLPKDSLNFSNHSALVDYRSKQAPMVNYSTISTELDRSRQGSYLTDKDRRYLREMEQRERTNKAEVNFGTMTNSQQYDNPEERRKQESRGRKLDYKLGDSLTRQLHEFENVRH